MDNNIGNTWTVSLAAVKPRVDRRLSIFRYNEWQTWWVRQDGKGVFQWTR